MMMSAVPPLLHQQCPIWMSRGAGPFVVNKAWMGPAGGRDPEQLEQPSGPVCLALCAHRAANTMDGETMIRITIKLP